MIKRLKAIQAISNKSMFSFFARRSSHSNVKQQRRQKVMTRNGKRFNNYVFDICSTDHKVEIHGSTADKLWPFRLKRALHSSFLSDEPMFSFSWTFARRPLLDVSYRLNGVRTEWVCRRSHCALRLGPTCRWPPTVAPDGS